jgi:hypothetical protein
MADTTLSPNSQELKDGEVIDITDLTPEVHGIVQDVETVPTLDHMSPSMVNDEPPLEQTRALLPQTPLPIDDGKGHSQTPSEDSMSIHSSCHLLRVSQRDPSHNDM